MKYIAIILASFILGYLTYPMFHPSRPQNTFELQELFRIFFAQEALIFAESKDAEEKLKAADAMYEKIMILLLSQLNMKGPENHPIPVRVKKSEVQNEPSLILHNSETKELELSKKNLTVAEKIITNKLDRNTFLKFSDFSPIGQQDSRVKKLLGSFKGKYKSKEPSRTGSDEDILMKLDERISIHVSDHYDNLTLAFSATTHNAFRSVPGDENLMLLNLPDNASLVIDIRFYPEISGKLFIAHLLMGDFKMQRQAR
jgi:hypothetical protein